jgi:DNA polymerase-3 subunit beta
MPTLQTDTMLQLTTDTISLRAALEACAKIVPKRPNKPILESVRLSSTEGANLAEARGTDLETYALATFPVQCVATGTAIVHLRSALDFLKVCEGSSVTLVVAGDSLGLTTDEGETFSLDTEDPDEYPDTPTVEENERGIVLDAVDFGVALGRAIPAATKTANRFRTDSLNVEMPEGGGLKLVATDGRRLHIATVDGSLFGSPTPEDLHPTILGMLPIKPAKVVAALLPKKYTRAAPARLVTLSHVTLDALDGTGWFRIALGFRAAVFVTYLSRAIEGEYPRYQAVIPTNTDGEFAIDSAEFLKRLKTVAASATKDRPGVTLEWNTATMGLRLSAGVDGNFSSSTLRETEVRAWPMVNGESARPAMLDPAYMAAALKAAGVATVELHWNAYNAPVEFRAPGFSAVIMPITA